MKISLSQLARVLETSKKIVKLDFSYKHKEGFLKALVEHPLSASSVIEAFKRVTQMKINTSVLDAKDYLNDPWIFITNLLSWCKDCVELTVDITYDGESDEYQAQTELSPFEAEIEQHFEEHLFPRLIWMKSLETYVLVKARQHGSYSNYSDCCVRSRLLEPLLSWMFSSDPHLHRALTRLWVQHFTSRLILLTSIAAIVPFMKVFRADKSDGFFIYEAELLYTNGSLQLDPERQHCGCFTSS